MILRQIPQVIQILSKPRASGDDPRMVVEEAVGSM